MLESVKEAYKFIENKKFSKAIKILESNECLNDAPSHCLRALCCAYDMNISEINKELSIISTLSNFEEESISQLFFACSYVNNYSCMVSILEKKFTENPKNKDIGEKYYLCLLYNKEWKKMQSLSLRLSQIHKEDAYKLYDCGICTIFDSMKDIKTNQEFKLLEMLTKTVYTNSKTKEERLMRNIQWVYIQILILSHKYEDAEKELTERLNTYIVSQYLYDDWKLLLTLYTYMNKIPEFISLFKTHLLSIYERIDWDFITLFLEAVDMIYSKEEHYTVVESFIHDIFELYEVHKNIHKTREFLLFEIDNEYYYYTILNKEDKFMNYKSKLFSFITLYKTKGSCYKDIYKYISILYNKDTQSILDFCHKELSLLPSESLSLDQIQIATLCLTLLFDMNEMTSDEAKHYYTIYQQAVKDNTVSARDQEILSLDYLILVLCKYVQKQSILADNETLKYTYIYTYITMLEDAFKERPHNMKLAICLSEAYASIHMYSKAYLYYHEMGITQMELLCQSSVYYLDILTCSYYASHNELKTENDLFQLFRTSAFLDCSEKLIQCFNNYTFIAGRTIYEYKEKLSNSIELYYPYIANAFYMFYTSIDNDKKEILSTTYNNIQHIPNDLTLSHTNMSLYNDWNTKKTIASTLCEGHQMISFFYFQKQLLSIYLNIYINTNITEDMKISETITEMKKTMHLLIELNQPSLTSYCHIISLFLTLYESILSNTLEENTIKENLTIYAKLLEKVTNTQNYLNDSELNTLILFYYQCLYPISLLLPKKKKGKKIINVYTSIYDLIKPFINASFPSLSLLDVSLNYKNIYSKPVDCVESTISFNASYNALLDAQVNTNLDIISSLKTISSLLKRNLKTKNY